MGQVNLTVNGRHYTVACDDGEEAHLAELGRYIDRRVTELVRGLGQAGDSKLLLMAALLISDELSEALGRIEELEGELNTIKQSKSFAADRAQQAESIAADVIEAAARKIEDIVGRLEAA